MRKFEWVVVEHRNVGKEIYHTTSLLEILDDGESRQFWGSIHMKLTEDGKYSLVAFDKNRVLSSPGIDADTIEDAQTIIEGFLWDNGILSEDDEIDYLVI